MLHFNVHPPLWQYDLKASSEADPQTGEEADALREAAGELDEPSAHAAASGLDFEEVGSWANVHLPAGGGGGGGGVGGGGRYVTDGPEGPRVACPDGGESCVF